MGTSKRSTGLRTAGTVVVVLLLLGLAASSAGAGVPAQAVVGTTFTYQGRLTGDSGSPVNGLCNFQFGLWDDPSAGSLVAGPQVLPDVQVSDGRFTVLLDFDSVFTGPSYWLEIAVRCTGDPNYSTLQPRQELTATPYALYSLSTGALQGHPVAAVAPASGQVLKWNGTVWTPGTDETGGGAGAWLLLGNAGTDPGNNFLGTTDAVSLVLAVSNTPGLWLEPNDTSTNLVGGYSGNWRTAGVVGSNIAGGGNDWAAPYGPNRVTDNYSAVGGGAGNQAGNGNGNVVDKIGATVAGGIGNQAKGIYSFIGGGGSNVISDTTAGAAICGGGRNTIGDLLGMGSYESFIGGGGDNQIFAAHSVIAGGQHNLVTDNYGTVAGGSSNTAGDDTTSNEAYATVGGGLHNEASAYAAAVPGGAYNRAANGYTLAAGRNAGALHLGAFVWADSSDFSFDSTAANTFNVRSTGGARFVSAIDGVGNPTAGVELAPGAGAWSSLSDRSAKENFAAVDSRALLEQLAQVPITTWNYKSQETTIRHIGPMAQDFYAAFDVGEDDLHISTLDADGVALAAIQGLHAENQELRGQVSALEARLAVLEAKAGPGAGMFWLLGLLPGTGLLGAGAIVWALRRRGGGR